MTLPSCPVCSETFLEFSEISAFPCGHTFHHKCILHLVKECESISKPAFCPCCNTMVDNIASEPILKKLLFCFECGRQSKTKEVIALEMRIENTKKIVRAMEKKKNNEIYDLEMRLKSHVALMNTLQEKQQIQNRLLEQKLEMSQRTFQNAKAEIKKMSRDIEVIAELASHCIHESDQLENKTSLVVSNTCRCTYYTEALKNILNMVKNYDLSNGPFQQISPTLSFSSSYEQAFLHEMLLTPLSFESEPSPERGPHRHPWFRSVKSSINRSLKTAIDMAKSRLPDEKPIVQLIRGLTEEVPSGADGALEVFEFDPGFDAGHTVEFDGKQPQHLNIMVSMNRSDTACQTEHSDGSEWDEDYDYDWDQDEDEKCGDTLCCRD